MSRQLPTAPRRVPFSLAVALLAAVSLAAPPARAVSPQIPGSAESTTEPSAAERLADLMEREWEERLRRNPLLATAVGRDDYDDRLPSLTPESLAEAVASARAYREELEAIPADELDETDRVSRQILATQLDQRIASFELGEHQMPFNADSGFHMGLARLPDEQPLSTEEDYDEYIARLRALPRLFDEQILHMRAGLERGFTVPRAVLDGYQATIEPHVVERPEESVFYAPFERFPPTVPDAAEERLRRAGAEAVMEGVVPAYRSFLTFFEEEYLPRARETIAAHDLPRGREFYREQIRQYTTLDLPPEEIHEIGVGEVARIRAEMEAVIEETGFAGSFDEFVEFLRTDPRFYAETPEELLKEASRIAKRMDAELPRFFGLLPRQPYGVEPVPDHIAPKYTAGRYVGAPINSTQAGTYWVNTHNLDQRPLYTLEALSLHEAVPGHHLQTALAQELDGLPEFRRHSYISAFGEGWGLYSERLGLEAGFYTDPYSDFGRLTYEMWRAARLVVDTGVHALGWSRQRAIDFLAANTALSLHEVTTEIDRYISWPAQALSYKLGELEIRRLRAEAEEELGEDFDIRAFHDTVLGNGSVPLPVLAAVVEEWIEERKAANGDVPDVEEPQRSGR